MRITRFVCWAGLLVGLNAFGSGSNAPVPPIAAWSLVWADEFDQPDGSAPDPTRWTYEVGGGGWGNQELESYTSRTRNARVQAGDLIIEAYKEAYTGSDGIQRNYTSARLKTQGLASWTYGRFEARIQIPRGQGMWPAFWTLGDNITSVGWPACGEIDVMENIGREPSIVHGTEHGPGSAVGFPSQLAGTKTFADDYHIYALEWSSGQLRWLVDNKSYGAVSPATLPKSAPWVFNGPEFLLLNLAVGGSWPGSPDNTTIFPQQMKVDFVRVYSATNSPTPVLRVQPTATGWQARWSGNFPQARLEYSAGLPLHWSAVAVTGARFGDEFGESLTPGFYRLHW